MIDALVVVLVRIFCGANALFASDLNDARVRIYFANHSSHFDFLVIWSALPARQRRIIRPAAAGDYWATNPVRHFLAVKLFNATLIERQRPSREDNPLASMLEVLDQGRSLIIFPEGTRGTGETVDEFHAGLYHLCKHRPETEAVPVYLANLNRILPKGEMLPLPLLGRAVFGAPITLAPGEGREEFLKRARRCVLQLADAP